MQALFKPAEPEVFPTTNVVERVRAAAKRQASCDAIVCDGRRLTWAQFDTRINKVADVLIDFGVKPGDNVAVLAHNCVAYAEIFMGTLRAGACIVPLSTMAASDALQRMIEDSGPRVLFVDAANQALVAPFVESTSSIGGAGLVALDFVREGWSDYETIVAGASATDPLITIDLTAPFNLIYSSGTTGVPKGILHDHLMRAVQLERVELGGYGPEARTLLSTPLYSNTTIVSFLPTMVVGATAVLMPKFDAHAYLTLLERERCTHTMLVPVQYKRIMDVEDFDSFDLSSMRMKFSTSAPLRADVKQDVLARFPGGLTEYYGLTEGGGVTILAAHEHPKKLHTVGLPAPGVELKLIDEAGNEVAPGEIGEVCGRSPAMMRGYYGRDDLTSSYLWHDGEGREFFRSGDMGRLDDEGFLILTDRKKDMIISGGLNIFANDLELVLLRDTDVIDAAVIGVPSDRWGETPLGLVVLKPGSQRSPDDILEDANRQLGKSHRLSAIEFRNSLPRSTIGKILKRELREPYWISQMA